MQSLKDWPGARMPRVKPLFPADSGAVFVPSGLPQALGNKVQYCSCCSGVRPRGGAGVVTVTDVPLVITLLLTLFFLLPARLPPSALVAQPLPEHISSMMFDMIGGFPLAY